MQPPHEEQAIRWGGVSAHRREEFHLDVIRNDLDSTRGYVVVLHDVPLPRLRRHDDAVGPGEGGAFPMLRQPEVARPATARSSPGIP